MDPCLCYMCTPHVGSSPQAVGYKLWSIVATKILIDRHFHCTVQTGTETRGTQTFFASPTVFLLEFSLRTVLKVLQINTTNPVADGPAHSGGRHARERLGEAWELCQEGQADVIGRESGHLSK